MPVHLRVHMQTYIPAYMRKCNPNRLGILFGYRFFSAFFAFRLNGFKCRVSEPVSRPSICEPASQSASRCFGLCATTLVCQSVGRSVGWSRDML